MDFLKKYWGLPVVLILSIFSILPLLNSGFFSMHDDTQVQRVFEMGKALKDGMFPVRWVQDLGYGYGYPIFNFYAPISYYIGGFINILGLDALISTKIMMVLGIIMAGVFMYYLAREFWGETGGVISGLFYLYAPYHAVDIYIRGDVAEFYAYAFIPLVFLGFYKIFSTLNNEKSNIKNQISKTWKWVSIASLGYAGIILSHNLTAMMVTPFLVILILIFFYVSYRHKNTLNIYFLILAAFFGLMVSAFYWLPVLLEMKYTNVLSQIGGGADFKNHFVCIQQLWNSQWGFGGSTKGCIDGMSFKVGKLHILFSAISLILIAIIVLKNKLFIHSNDTYHQSNKIIAILFSLFGLLISLLLMLEVSKPVWEVIPLMLFFQYPWRFLILLSFFLSFLAGSGIWFLQSVISKNDWKRLLPYIVSAVIIFLLIFLDAKLFNPQTIFSGTADDYINEYNLKWRTSKISDEYMPKGFKKPEKADGVVNQRLIINGGVSGVVEASSRTQSYLYNINVIRKSDFLLKIAPFPAWRAELNDKPFVLSTTDRGYIFSLTPGRYSLNVSYKQTIAQIFGNILSVSGLAVLIIGIIYFRINNEKER